MAKLNDKHKRFCEEYLIDLNATQAYLRAGYRVSERVAAVNAARLLAKADIQAYIARRQKELQHKTGITQERVLAELAAIGFSNGSDFARVVAKSKIDSITGEKKNYQDIELVNTDELTPEKKKALSSIKYGKYGIVVETYDKLRALELLGKHLGLFDCSQRDSSNGMMEKLIRGLKEGG